MDSYDLHEDDDFNHNDEFIGTIASIDKYKKGDYVKYEDHQKELKKIRDELLISSDAIDTYGWLEENIDKVFNKYIK
jgi:hypothetical protein